MLSVKNIATIYISEALLVLAIVVILQIMAS
jgi:hypothetical protein